MTPERFRFMRIKGYELTVGELSGLLGVSMATIKAYERGETPISEPIAILLNHLRPGEVKAAKQRFNRKGPQPRR